MINGYLLKLKLFCKEKYYLYNNKIRCRLFDKDEVFI